MSRRRKPMMPAVTSAAAMAVRTASGTTSRSSAGHERDVLERRQVEDAVGSPSNVPNRPMTSTTPSAHTARPPRQHAEQGDGDADSTHTAGR